MASANQKLQQWLLEIEKGLIDLTPGDRAKIIFDLETQIRTQLSTDEANNDQKIDAALASAGTPVQIIAKIRSDRGLSATAATGAQPVPPTKPAKAPSKFWKWATIILVGGFFSFIALIIIVPLLVMKFVTSNSFHKTFNVSTFGRNGSSYHIKGSQNGAGLEHLIFHATNGNIILKSGSDSFSYDCTIKGDEIEHDVPLAYPDETSIALNFDDLDENEGVDCSFGIPKAMGADVTVINGAITASNFSRDFKGTINNGKITFSKDPSTLFLVNASASVGQIQGLEDFNQAQVSMKQDAPHARADLKVTIGQIILSK